MSREELELIKALEEKYNKRMNEMYAKLSKARPENKNSNNSIPKRIGKMNYEHFDD